MSPSHIYLDHNATAPLLPEVAAAIAECYAAGCANPASQHEPGRNARRRLEEAREEIADRLGADVTRTSNPDRLIFTSGGTESNNLALFGLASRRGQRILISAIEHPSVTAAAERLARAGHQLVRLPVLPTGVVDTAALQAACDTPPDVASVMLGNNETGVLQPVAQIASHLRRLGTRMHTDAAQVVGKVQVHFGELGVDAMSLTAHKFHGPRGIGALLLRGGVELDSQLVGGPQQQGLRAGTEDLALVVGLRQALRCYQRDADARRERLAGLRDRLEAELSAAIPDLVVHGAAARRLPHVSDLAFVGVDRQALFMALDVAGVACSTGSACASGASDPSPTLVAMGCANKLIESSLRFSVGATTTEADVLEAAGRIVQTYNRLRSASEPKKAAGDARGACQNSLY